MSPSDSCLTAAFIIAGLWLASPLILDLFFVLVLVITDWIEDRRERRIGK